MITPSCRMVITGACCLATAVWAIALGGCATADPALSSDDPGYSYRPLAVDGSGNLHNGATYRQYLALRQLDQGGGMGPAASGPVSARGGGAGNNDMEFNAIPPFFPVPQRLLYDPTVSMVATGSVLDVEGTVSADRRYVTITARPQVTGNLEMFNYVVNRP